MTDADSLQPNYLTVNPDGTIGADFTGKINAQGLILPAADSNTPPPDNKIQWTLSNGAAIADIVGYYEPNGTINVATTALDSLAQAATDQSNVILRAYNSLGNVQASLEAHQNGQGGGWISYEVGSNTASYSGTIMDSTGSSNFLQLLSAQELQLAIGNGTFTWPGASAGSSIVTVNHNIGRVPSAVLLTPGPAPTRDAIAISQVTAATTTSFSAYAYDPAGSPTAGATLPFSWIAIG